MTRAFGLPESFYAPETFEQAVHGVEIDGASGHGDVFSVAARRVIRVLQRRAAKRTGTARPNDSSNGLSLIEASPAAVDEVCDLSGEMSWSDRCAAYARVLDLSGTDATVGVVLRNLSADEPNVLVDGASAAGCFVDLAVVMSLLAEGLRAGRPRLVVSTGHDLADDASLQGVIDIAHDRLGIERGTVVVAQRLVSTEAAAVA